MDPRADESGPAGPERRPLPPDMAPVVFYRAQVDVDLRHSELRFNEALHPDQILRALLENSGPFIIEPWPPPGYTERNRFLLLALGKLHIDLSLDDAYNPGRVTILDDAWTNPCYGPDAIREWAYATFPGGRRAREAGGVYRRCDYEASVLGTGRATRAYRLFPDGMSPVGLEDDEARQAFTRGLVLADLQRRIDAIR